MAETCGSSAFGGPCTLAKGHNMGRVDIPAYHRHHPPEDRTERLFCAALVAVGNPDYMNRVLRQYLAWRDGQEPEPTWAFPQGGDVDG